MNCSYCPSHSGCPSECRLLYKRVRALQLEGFHGTAYQLMRPYLPVLAEALFGWLP